MFKGKIPAELVRSINENNCIFFAGSGLSSNQVRSNGLKLPNWYGFLIELLEWCKDKELLYNNDYSEILQLIEGGNLLTAAEQLQINSRYHFAEFLDIVFNDPELIPGNIHTIIHTIPFKAYLTTNYDSLIENAYALKNNGRALSTFTQEDIVSQSYKLLGSKQYLFKLHGDANRPETIVLGSRSYGELFYRNNAYKKILTTLFMSNRVLFVGFGGSDPDILDIIESISYTFSSNMEHYILLPKNTINTTLRKRWREDKGLFIIEYDKDDDHSQVEEFLIELANLTKKKVIESETFDITNALLTGSNAYYNFLRGKNGRFNNLNISELILSGHNSNMFDFNVFSNDVKKSLFMSIKSTWKASTHNSVIVGEGGMGKTVSMINLWMLILESGLKCIPIYISLNEYNGEDNPNFIIEFIQDYYLKNQNNKENTKAKLWELMFTKNEHDHEYLPSVILLLDGFNEVTSDKSNLLIELNDIRRNCPGVQIILTSRFDMRSTYNWEEFNLINLTGLDKSQIFNYLKENNKNEINPDLVALLENPMMLTLYCSSCELIEQYKNNKKYCFKEKISTVGELLWNFCECIMIKSINNNINPNAFDYANFYFKHLIPYIGYYMELNGVFVIRSIDIKKCIYSAFEYFISQDYIYVNSYLIEHTLVKRYLLGTQLDQLRVYNEVMDYICNELYLLTNEMHSYLFIHQYLRDYYSSFWILSDVELNYEIKKLPSSLKIRVLPYNMKKMLADIADINDSKYANLKTYLQLINSNLLFKTIEVCRFIFDGSVGYIIRNILETFVVGIGKIAGINLSNLDLVDINFNGLVCVSNFKEGRAIVDFSGSKFGVDNFLPKGHSRPVKTIVYNEFKLMTGSEDSNIKVWDALTGECKITYSGHRHFITKLVFEREANFIISSSADQTVRKWNSGSDMNHLVTSGYYNWISDICLDSSRNIIFASTFDGNLLEIGLEDLKVLRRKKVHNRWINSLDISPDFKKILIASDDNTLIELNIKDLSRSNNYVYELPSVSCCIYSHDYKFIIFTGLNGEIVIYDIINKASRMLNGHEDRINSLCMNEDGNKFLTSSLDKTTKEWDLKSGECLQTFTYNNSKIFTATYGEKSKSVYISLDDGAIIEFSIDTGEVINRMFGCDDQINMLKIDENNKRIYVAADKTIKEWDIKKNKFTNIYISHSRTVVSIDIANSGDRILSVSSDCEIIEWVNGVPGLRISPSKFFSRISNVIYAPLADKFLVYDNNIIGEYSFNTCSWKYHSNDKSKITVVKYSTYGDYIIYGTSLGGFFKWNSQSDEYVVYVKESKQWGNYISSLEIGRDDISDFIIYSTDRHVFLLREGGINVKIIASFDYDYIISIYYNDSSKILYVYCINKYLIDKDNKNYKIYEVHVRSTKIIERSLESHRNFIVSRDDSMIISWANNTALIFSMNNSKLVQLTNIPGLYIQNCKFNDAEYTVTVEDNRLKEILMEYGGDIN